MKTLDVDASGTIDYEEFLAATMSVHQLMKEVRGCSRGGGVVVGCSGGGGGAPRVGRGGAQPKGPTSHACRQGGEEEGSAGASFLGRCALLTAL